MRRVSQTQTTIIILHIKSDGMSNGKENIVNTTYIQLAPTPHIHLQLLSVMLERQRRCDLSDSC